MRQSHPNPNGSGKRPGCITAIVGPSGLESKVRSGEKKAEALLRDKQRLEADLESLTKKSHDASGQLVLISQELLKKERLDVAHNLDKLFGWSHVTSFTMAAFWLNVWYAAGTFAEVVCISCRAAFGGLHCSLLCHNSRQTKVKWQKSCAHISIYYQFSVTYSLFAKLGWEIFSCNSNSLR